MEIENLKKAIQSSLSISEVCKKLHLKNNGYTFKKIKQECVNNNISLEHFTGGVRKEFDVDKMIKVVSESTTFSEVCRAFGIKAGGGNFRTIKKRIKELDLDVSHFEGKSFTGKRRLTGGVKQKKLDDVMVENSQYSRRSLKNRLIKDGILDYKCVECGNEGFWNGEKLTLQLDHINGVNNDNRLENLRILCPNCHSQTKNYAGKNNNNE
jgi:hypothetical protein